MKRTSLSLVSFFISVGLVISLESCDNHGINHQKKSTEISQQQIEQMATISLDEAVIDRGFTFNNQRQVTLDFKFPEIQYSTPISIFSELDQTTHEPINLLEKGQLQNSNRYRGIISVSNTLESLVLVLNDNIASPIELTIDLNDRAQYSFR